MLTTALEEHIAGTAKGKVTFELRFECSILRTGIVQAVTRDQNGDAAFIRARVLFDECEWHKFVVGPGEIVRNVVFRILRACADACPVFGTVEDLAATEDSIERSEKVETGEADKHKHTVHRFTIQHLVNPALDDVTTHTTSFKAFRCKFISSEHTCDLSGFKDMMHGYFGGEKEEKKEETVKK
jgi:hypothetical protein